MKVRILALHYSKGKKYRLFQIDYGVKYESKVYTCFNKYRMVQVSHKYSIATDFSALHEQFENVKVKVNEKEYATIHHKRFNFYPTNQFYSVAFTLVIPAIAD